MPGDDPDDFEWLLFRQDGVLTWRQARRHLSESAIRHRLRTRHWRVVQAGIYLTHNGPLSREQLLWAAVLAAGSGAMLAGPTALAEYGLHRQRGPGIHLLVPAHRRVRGLPGNVIVHRSTALPPDDVHAMAAPPRTMPARSVVDAAQWAGSDDAACEAIASAFQRRLVTVAEIESVLGRLRRARRAALIRRVAADAAGGAHSLAELDYLRLNRRHGLPEPTRQAPRKGADGRQRYLDVLYEPWSVHVEIDGHQHTDPRAYWADMRRQNAVWIAGDRVLRFPAWLVRRRPDEVFGQVRAALLAAGWCP